MKSKLRLLFVILVMMLSACHFNRPFDSSGWIENPDNRFQMVADLEDSRLLIGKSRRELMEILSNECKESNRGLRGQCLPPRRINRKQ